MLPDTDIVVMDADEEYAERAVDRRSFVAGQAIVYSTWRMCFADPVIGFLTPAITSADISAAARYGVRRPYAAVPDMLYQRYSLRAEMACGLLIQSYQQLASSEGTHARDARWRDGGCSQPVRTCAMCRRAHTVRTRIAGPHHAGPEAGSHHCSQGGGVGTADPAPQGNAHC